MNIKAMWCPLVCLQTVIHVHFMTLLDIIAHVYKSNLFPALRRTSGLQQVLRQDHWSNRHFLCTRPKPPITNPVFCLVTLLTTLPLSDLFLLVSTDLISVLIKYLPCPATNYELHLHTTLVYAPGRILGVSTNFVWSPELSKNIEEALHHNICLVRPWGMEQTCK